MPNSLRIGVFVRDKVQQKVLQALIEECGHQLTESVLRCELQAKKDSSHPAGLDEDKLDVWIVLTDEDSADNEEFADQIDDWLENLCTPAIICDGIGEGKSALTNSDEYMAWSQRLKKKLSHLEGTINLEQDNQKPAHDVWVLAASTGGPAAVKEFLSELPPGLDVGFVYVQHINRGFDDTLARTISKHSHYPAYLATNGDVVNVNQVAIISPEKVTEVLDNKTFEVREENWQAPYTPSVDCIIASVACAYPNRCGAIVFTGMGDDGAASCRIMHRNGGKVWVQTPGSCTSDSMPQSVIEQGCVDFKGTPYILAQRLVQTVQQSKQHASGQTLGRKLVSPPLKKVAG